MRRRPVNMKSKYIALGGILLLIPASASGQKSVPCNGDGDHTLIDVKQIAIQYDASSFAGTLSSLSMLVGTRLEVAPIKLQDAAAGTQKLNEFVKALAEGYNSCAITRQQYADGLNRIYPRLKDDAGELEAIRKVISDGQKADTKRLQALLDSYWSNLRQFAEASGNEIILERIEALASGQGQIIEKEDLILAKLKEMDQRRAQAPLPTPAEVGSEVSEIRKEMQAKADEAEKAYKQGYALLDQYRFREAIPYLQQALAAVPLPDFYLALGLAYWELPDLAQAESTLRQGLTAVTGKNDEAHEAPLANDLGLILKAEGDLDGAVSYIQRALRIDEKVYGPEHRKVADLANNIGIILKKKGDLDGALRYIQQALKIDEKIDGPEHPEVATLANNIGAILQDKGDLDGALTYTKRALKIDEKVYGPDDPTVAIPANNIGQILKSKGDLDGALTYTQRALDILTKRYGLENPSTITVAVNLRGIKRAMEAKKR